MQSEFEIHVVMDISCSVLDLMYINTMNAIVKACNRIRDTCRCVLILQCFRRDLYIECPCKDT